MVLRCAACRWRPAADVTQGVVAAHFEVEHDTEDIRLELIAVCPRDDSELSLIRTQHRATHLLHIYDCPQCYRTYRIRQGHSAASTT